MTEQNDLFQKIGVDINNDKINIDLGKTKAFFESLQGILTEKAQNIQQDIAEGKVDLGEQVGIKVDNEHINIDLEKTKNFMADLGKRFENFLGEIDKAVEDINKK
jgi:ABC-type bacteriocin/lantibiotic exporter with double-glycine peptidase domain